VSNTPCSEGQLLTLFAIPKPFHGHFEIIQRNAIISWTHLRPRPEIILFGDDEGTAEVAKQFGLRHVPGVSRNEYGTPLLNDLFAKSQTLATHDLLCYVNADIILMGDFMEAIRRVARWKPHFLIVGQRWDIEIKEPLNFSLGWENRLRSYVVSQGQLYSPAGIDYFVFPRGFWSEIPPFAIGRTVWDNWLLYRALSRKAPVINITRVAMGVHQNHNYLDFPGGKEFKWHGPEARRNLELAAGYEHVFTLADCTHLLTSSGLEMNLTRERLLRYLETMPVLFPRLRPLAWLTRLLSNRLRQVLNFVTGASNPRRPRKERSH